MDRKIFIHKYIKLREAGHDHRTVCDRLKVTSRHTRHDLGKQYAAYLAAKQTTPDPAAPAYTRLTGHLKAYWEAAGPHFKFSCSDVSYDALVAELEACIADEQPGSKWREELKRSKLAIPAPQASGGTTGSSADPTPLESPRTELSPKPPQQNQQDTDPEKQPSDDANEERERQARFRQAQAACIYQACVTGDTFSVDSGTFTPGAGLEWESDRKPAEPERLSIHDPRFLVRSRR